MLRTYAVGVMRQGYWVPGYISINKRNNESVATSFFVFGERVLSLENQFQKHEYGTNEFPTRVK